jgi:hypothetical protein
MPLREWVYSKNPAILAVTVTGSIAPSTHSGRLTTSPQSLELFVRDLGRLELGVGCNLIQ